MLKKNATKQRERLTKRKQQLMLVLLFFGLGVLLQYQQSQEHTSVLIRGDPGSGEETQDLTFTVKDLVDEEAVSVNIAEQKLNETQVQTLLKNALKEMEASFLEEGQTLSHITTCIHMQESYANGLVEAQWSMEPLQEVEKERVEVEDNVPTRSEMEKNPEKWQDIVVKHAETEVNETEDIMEEDGSLCDEAIPKAGLDMQFQVVFSYQNYTMQHRFQGKLYRRKQTKAQQMVQKVQNALAKELVADTEKKEIVLPKTVDQKQILWEKGDTTNFLLIFAVLGLAMAILLEVKEKQDVVKKQKTIRLQLERDYPDFVSQMAILLGAGMNMERVFRRLADTYQMQRRHQMTEEHEVYEQVLISVQQMQDGIGEVRVFEQFGERCAIPEYRRLCSYISQNLRKGTKALAAMLEKESEEALHKRRQNVQKAAEEAGTKLLLPMMLMLVDIMAIIMVGVFLQM